MPAEDPNMKAISFAREQAFAFVFAPKPCVRIQSLVGSLGATIAGLLGSWMDDPADEEL